MSRDGKESCGEIKKSVQETVGGGTINWKYAHIAQVPVIIRRETHPILLCIMQKYMCTAKILNMFLTLGNG